MSTSTSSRRRVDERRYPDGLRSSGPYRIVPYPIPIRKEGVNFYQPLRVVLSGLRMLMLRTCDSDCDRASLIFVTLNGILLGMAFALDAVGADQPFGKHHRKTEMKCGDDGDITLQVDQGCLEVVPPPQTDVRLYAQSSECVGCPYWSVGEASRNSSAFLAVNATADTHVMVSAMSDGSRLCKMSYRFGEFGAYLLDVPRCQVTVVREPVDSALPILYTFAALAALALAWCGTMRVYKSRDVMCSAGCL